MEVILSGPLFNGEADRAAASMVERIRHHVASSGMQRLYIRFGRVLRDPTPIYTTRLRTRRLATRDVIDDRRMVYGPWLEGTGSRNKTTRFKGYRTFRIVTATLQIDAKDLAQPIVALHMDRMNF